MKINKWKGEIIFCYIAIIVFFICMTVMLCLFCSLAEPEHWLFIVSIGVLVVISATITFAVISFIAIHYTKDKFYIIEKEGITYYSKNEPIIFIDIKDVVAVHYSPWWHMLIGGLGFTTGAFNIKVINQVYEPKTYKCFCIFNKNDGSALISFYCLKKTREKIAKILDLYLL